MRSPKLIIPVCSALMLIGIFGCSFVTEHVDLEMPHIEGLSAISGFGLALFIIVFIILRLAIKNLLAGNISLKIGELAAYGILIVFIAELIYQLYRYYISDIDFILLLQNVALGTLMFGVLAYLISFYFKTRKGNQLIMMVIIIILMSNGIKFIRNQYFKNVADTANER